MCVLAFAYKMPGLGQLVLLANRDEYYTRPTRPLDFWPERDDMIGGQDLQAGGSWLAIRNNGRLAAVTAIRDGFTPPGERSRGELVSQFVLGSEDPLRFAERLATERPFYGLFNLLFGNAEDLFFYHSRHNQLSRVTPGLHTLSNATLDTPWFKCERLAAHLHGLRRAPTEDQAYAWLEDRAQAPSHQLPNSGVGSAMERMLSPVFVVGRDYGTRASMLLTVSSRGDIAMSERSVGLAGKEHGRRRFTLRPAVTP